jgi:hypothetical protein
MAATKEFVSFLAVLRGQGHEATCTLKALLVIAPGGEAPELTRLKIVDVSKMLPEGDYELTVNSGPPMAVRYSDGEWLSGNPA